MPSSTFSLILNAIFGRMPSVPAVDLDGKVAIVTGASSGIGVETAISLASMGCQVILACRNPTKAEEVLQKITEEVGSTKCEIMKLDLASFRSIREFVEEFKAKNYPLHFLINNAGVLENTRKETEDGHEMNFGVNHLGHFLLTNLLLDALKRSAPSRIINLSSEAHRSADVDFDDLESTNLKKWNQYGINVYGASKTCNIHFTKELQRRFENDGITSYAVHPGFVNSELSRNAPGFLCLIAMVATKFARNTKDGAQTTLWTVVKDHLTGGAYYSDCAEANPEEHALNQENAFRLWEISEQLTGLAANNE